MDKPKLIVNASIIKIIGVFEFDDKSQNLDSLLRKHHFKNNPIVDEPDNTHKNLWYPEFRNMFILEKGENSSTIYLKSINKELTFFVRENQATKEKEYLNISILNVELFTFKEGLHFFSIEVAIKQNELSFYSDLTYVINKFNSTLFDDQKMYSWVNWIEKNCLAGIKIASTEKSDVKVDDYSGSKFKLFTVLNLVEEVDVTVREELLYDIGCGAKIGSAGGNENLSPSADYFKSLLDNKISVFNNYTILPLFDSVTVLGNYLFDDTPERIYAKKTWSESYFRIVLYNLFIKFNLYRYNSELQEDSEIEEVVLRDRFENFLNVYNFSHISYNFLPNLIYQNHRDSLDVDNELKLFQKRINRISESIQEEQQKRSNVLLAIVGVFTSISSVQPVFEFLEGSRAKLDFNPYGYYFFVILIITLLAIPVLIYAFPQKYKLFKNKWKNKKNSY